MTDLPEQSVERVPSEEELRRIVEKWLQLCGACDGGLAMNCECSADDPRDVIHRLVEAVRVLSTSLHEVEEARRFAEDETARLQGQVERVRALHQPMRDGAFSLISWAYCSCGATETRIAEDGYPSTGPAIYPCATLRALDAGVVTE